MLDMLGNYADVKRPISAGGRSRGVGSLDGGLTDGSLAMLGRTEERLKGEGEARLKEVVDAPPAAPRRRLVGCGWSKSQELVETRVDNLPLSLPTTSSSSSSRHRTSHSLRSRKAAASGAARTSGGRHAPPPAPEMLL